MIQYIIETRKLTKYYGKSIRAVNGINLRIPKGALFTFLGPNGAGKSTTISMLTTILPPTKGTAIISGFDIRKHTKKIRQIIGVCPQELSIYDNLTARENIYLIAKMHKMRKRDYVERTDELLGKMGLTDRANDKVKKFSYGMKRRVNVLMAVVHDPEIIFFDEPSTSLDPQSRRVVWDFIKEFQNKNKTIILTTHNMEEADVLSNNLVIIDHGRIIAAGTPEELKGTLGRGDIINFRINSYMRSDEVIPRIQMLDFIDSVYKIDDKRIELRALDGLRRISEIMDAVQVKMLDITIRRNSLEDVFINLTGRSLRDT
ncbi:MAG: ABC transporter ATP-binding protein [Promethearchaeota archaeon]